MTTRKVTLPFPDYSFRIDCNHLPEVRQWLEDNDVRWGELNGSLPTTTLLDVRYSVINLTSCPSHPVLYGVSLNYWNTFNFESYIYISEEQLFQPIITNEEVLVLFLKKHRMFSACKRYIESTYIDPPYPELDVSFIIDRTSTLYPKWQALITKFSLEGTIDLNIISKSR